jgi:hypothetical protein
MRLLAFVFGLFSIACASIDRGPAQSAPFDLEDLRFESELDPRTFRSHYSFLTDAQYASKLKGSLTRPLMFFRSFVNSYYADLSSHLTSASKMSASSPRGICLGDPHPENFGFLAFTSGAQYVFNDLDDAGECPIAWDALRYFTALRLSGARQELFEHALDLYADIVRAKKAPKKLSSRFFPNLEKKRKQTLKRHVHEDQFVFSDELRALTDAKLRSDLATSISKLFSLKPQHILDFGAVSREQGGSAGLDRYWVLIDPPSGRPPEVLELKERARPAVQYGNWPSRDLSYEDLERLVWGDSSPLWSGSVSVDGRTFAVRSRTKEDLSQDELSENEWREVIEAQVSLLATTHARTWGREIPQLKTWIRNQSLVLHNRYLSAFKSLLP